MKTSQFIRRSLLVLSAGFALAACQPSNKNGDKIVAKGDGIEITDNDLYKELKESAGKAGVQQLVFEKIFEAELGKDKVKKLEDEVETDTATLMAQYGGPEKFLAVANQSGYHTVDEYKKAVRYYKLMSETLMKNIDIKDDDVHVAYDAYQAPRELSHILVDKEDEAKDLIKQLDKGADFASLAKKHSKDKGSAEKGGSLGEVPKGKMVAEFEDAAFKLKEGEYSKKPVKSQFGYHIIKVDKVKEKGSFDEEKDQLIRQLKQEKLGNGQQIQAMMMDILKRYNVKITDKELEGALDNFLFNNQQSQEGQALPSGQGQEAGSEEKADQEKDAKEKPQEKTTDEEK